MQSAELSGTTAVLRHFNRTYTQRVGVLEESFLGTGRPLAVSRLLFEIGRSDGASVADLRRRLDLDSGQLSRTLRHLERDGLIETVPDESDGRRRLARLTAAGRQAWRDLDRRSEAKATGIVEALTPRQRARLAEALMTADLLVRAATVQLREVEVTDPLARRAQQAFVDELHERFGFAGGAADEPEPGSTFVVATAEGSPVAYGGIRPAPDTVPDAAEVKRMWVHSDWRGAGLGSRMLRHLEQLALERGYREMVLDTNGALAEAIALYERSGYHRIERYNDNPDAELFFRKSLR